MNYLKIYNQLIHRAKTRSINEYKEKHHIIPRCLNGTDDIDNLVDLTPEEHYIAHLLLVKIYPDNQKLIHAAVMMTVTGLKQRRNNKLYGWLRRRHSESISDSQSGNGNSQFGRYWICNTSTGEIRRINSSDTIPDGWIRGKTGFTKCEICNQNTGTKQRRFCKEHRPAPIPPKTTMFKGSESAKKLSVHCKNRKKEEHPQFGKRWVNNTSEQIMIPQTEIVQYLNNGWIKGKLKKPSKLI